MKKMLGILSVVGLMLGGNAKALDFDYFGSINYDNDVLLFDFSVDSLSLVTVFSSSWDNGGFDPMLGIWDDDGELIAFQDDGHNVGSTLSNGTLYDYGDWDSWYQVNLAAGGYTASLSMFPNFNNGSNLSDGFYYDNETPLPIPNGQYAFHLVNVDQAGPVGVPDAAGTFLLLTLSVSGLGALRRRLAV